MENIAIVFGGGKGQRMENNLIPKQFITINSKPLIIHTIEKFQKCELITNIVVVCLSSYVQLMQELVHEFRLDKVVSIVEGGCSGQESIFNGIKEAIRLFANEEDAVVLIHDAVRPLIDEKTIIDNINNVRKFGSSITVTKVTESIVLADDKENILSSLKRDDCYFARAPQSFYLKDIYKAHLLAKKENKISFVDSSELMRYYGYSLHYTIGPVNNIKITTQIDLNVFKALINN